MWRHLSIVVAPLKTVVPNQSPPYSRTSHGKSSQQQYQEQRSTTTTKTTQKKGMITLEPHGGSCHKPQRERFCIAVAALSGIAEIFDIYLKI